MLQQHSSHDLITDANVTDFFRGLVTQAVEQHSFEATPEAQHYLVNLLSFYTHSDTLFEQTEDGLCLRPLALLYSDAIDAPHYEARNQSLKRLGDVAMFISGVFPDSLNRKMVDLDYYIAMGGCAYGYLSNNARESHRWRALGDIFDELSSRFAEFVELLGEVCGQANFNQATDVLRMYEVWLRTGNKRLARRLRQLGIEPNHAITAQPH